MGDLNINLFKIEEHRQTSNYLDIIYIYMYSHSLFALISKPTRVTGNSVTLIDHIFTNNFETNVTLTQGILCTTISDHYAVFQYFMYNYLWSLCCVSHCWKYAWRSERRTVWEGPYSPVQFYGQSSSDSEQVKTILLLWNGTFVNETLKKLLIK